MTPPFTVVALIAAYNEEDIIEACLDHLRRQGISSYLLDDGSTDRTVDRARPFVGNGLIGIEPLPQTTPPTFSLERILARKEALACSLGGSWFINQDADEFRESLWSELDLRQAIERVDRLGWNAIEFEIFTIRPVGDPDSARADPAESPSWYSPGGEYDRVQVRAWKQAVGNIDLRSSGGHDAVFEARSVFPLRFPMRHYPVRSHAQGIRKVFSERLPRFDPKERDRGWHVQYDRCGPSDVLVAAPADVTLYDPLDARILSALRNRDLEIAHEREAALSAMVEGLSGQVHQQSSALEGLKRRETDLTLAIEQARVEVARLSARETELIVTIDQGRAEKAQLEQEVRAVKASVSLSAQNIEGLQADCDACRAAVARVEAERQHIEAAAGHVTHELALVYASRSWRWMKPLRTVFRLFGGR